MDFVLAFPRADSFPRLREWKDVAVRVEIVENSFGSVHASLNWFETRSEGLESEGFVLEEVDRCAFIRKDCVQTEILVSPLRVRGPPAPTTADDEEGIRRAKGHASRRSGRAADGDAFAGAFFFVATTSKLQRRNGRFSRRRSSRCGARIGIVRPRAARSTRVDGF